MRWIKNECIFYDGHDELRHHAKFGEDRTMAVGAKKRCLFFFTGRMPGSDKLQVLNLLTGQKSGFSPRRGDSYTN